MSRSLEEGPMKMRLRLRLLALTLTVPAVIGLVILGPGSGIGVSAGAGSNRPPQAAFSYTPAGPTINDLVTFDGSGSFDPDGRITLYEWDFDGDGDYDSTTGAAVIQWLYDEPGSYTVSLRVTDNGGATASTTGEVIVSPAPVAVRQRLFTPLAPNKALPGDWIRVEVEISVRKTINGLGLAAEPPQGWRVREVDNGGATFKRGGGQYQWLWVRGLLSGDRLRIVYEVRVAESAPPGLYKIGGQVSSFSPRFKIPIPKEVEVRVP
ncbi:TPA: PKD domain-containing protein [Candidatus Bipolaricaulota bacterium]|nr:PKD domain-containing protein [Candidatus Bipolaricaulota bacterium]